MTANALIVLPQHPVVKIPTTDVVEYEEEDSDEDGEYTAESYEDIQADIASLELRLSADGERCEKSIQKLNQKNMDLLVIMQNLEAELIERQAELAASDDLVDQVTAEEQKSLLDAFLTDTDHETRDNEEDADAMAANERSLSQRCRSIFRAIAKGTHPDKCRHLPKEEQERRTSLFLDAKAAMVFLNYDALEKIHAEVFSKAYAKVNLMQRLLLARQRRDELYRKMTELRESPEWQLYCVALRFGEDTAHEQYRMSLLNGIEGMRHILASMNKPEGGDASDQNLWTMT